MGGCFLAAVTDLIEFARQNLPILLGTRVSVPRTHTPRPVHCIH
jgi:hypothetical protein